MDSTNSEIDSSPSSGPSSTISESSVSPEPNSTPDSPEPNSTPASPKPNSTQGPVPKKRGLAPEAKPESDSKKQAHERIVDMVLNASSSTGSQQPQQINGTEGRPNPFREAAASQSADEQEQKQQQQQQQQQQVSEPDRSPSTPRLGSNADD
jgi:hypothetical protein